MERPPNLHSRGADLKTLMRDYERRIIEAALTAASGNQRRAARALGLLPTTLHEKMKRLGLIRRERVSEGDASREEQLQEAS